MPQLLCHLFGDYILQSDWMAQNKTKAHWPALVHALLYALLFVPLCWHAGYSITSVASSLQSCLDQANAAGGGLCAADSGVSLTTFYPGNFRWFPWLVIFGTHFLIDRYRLARYVVWAKNFIAPKGSVPDLWNGQEQKSYPRRNWDWNSCKDTGGYAPNTPAFMWVWLMIAADNTLHLAINYLALRYL